jgi:hypothetical protein
LPYISDNAVFSAAPPTHMFGFCGVITPQNPNI